jgi:hypothetical protein
MGDSEVLIPASAINTLNSSSSKRNLFFRTKFQ